MASTETLYPYECNGQSDISIFEGMVGFEDFNPMDDSSITTIFDDLQEGTLLSILKDELFDDILSNRKETCVTQQSEDQIKEIDACTSSNSCEENSFASSTEIQYYDEHMQLSCRSDNVHLLRVPDDTSVFACSLDPMPKKRIKCENYENSVGREKRSSVVNLQHLIECVQHDHCYTAAEIKNKKMKSSTRRGSFTSERSVHSTSSDSQEEGSNSDGGYDTMSATTSPGTRSSSEDPKVLSLKKSPPPPQITLSPLIPVEEHIDPVALIDARIKHYMCTRDVNLTEEEKETLKTEGLPIPTTLPFTKAEEKALRNVRRKIRNKVAAQESRKRKKEHMFTLEERVKEYGAENLKLRKRIETLESENKLLLSHLKKFQVLTSSGGVRRSTQVGASLMVIALCFAVIIGGLIPKEIGNSQPSDYTTSSVRSRSLLSLEYRANFQSIACDWFRHIFATQPDFSCFSNNIGGYMYRANRCKRKDHLPSLISSLNEELINVSGYGCEDG